MIQEKIWPVYVLSIMASLQLLSMVILLAKVVVEMRETRALQERVETNGKALNCYLFNENKEDFNNCLNDE